MALTWQQVQDYIANAPAQSGYEQDSGTRKRLDIPGYGDVSINYDPSNGRAVGFNASIPGDKEYGNVVSSDGFGGLKEEKAKYGTGFLDTISPSTLAALAAAAVGSGIATGWGGMGYSGAGASSGAAGASGIGEGLIGAGGYSVPTAAELTAFGADVGGMGMTGAEGIGAASSVVEGGAGAAGYGSAAGAAAGAGGEYANEMQKLIQQNAADPGSLFKDPSILSKLMSDPKLLQQVLSIGSSVFGKGGDKSDNFGGAGGGSAPASGNWNDFQKKAADNYFNKSSAHIVDPYYGNLATAPQTGGEHQWFIKPEQAITKTFQQAFGRDPSAADVTNWTGEYDKGRTMADINKELTSYPEATNRFVGPQPQKPKYADGGQVHGALSKMQNGQSDDVDAQLSIDEFVIPADVVSAIGSGSSNAGASILQDMMRQIRHDYRSADHDEIPQEIKSPLAYMRDRMKGE